MKKIIFLLSLITFEIFAYDIDFDTSYERYGKDSLLIQNLKNHSIYSKRYNLAKDLYNKNINKKSNIYGTIPKIIHQIWIGKAMPDNLRPFVEKWKNLKNFEYKLWTEEDILKLDFDNKDIYLDSSNYGEKTDIARIEILKQFGGLYVDTDYEYVNIENLENLLNSYDIILGFEPIHLHTFFLGNAFFAASKNHPFINKISKDLKKNFKKHFFDVTMLKTGPYFITEKVFENIDLFNGGILLPPTFLYPIACDPSELLALNDSRREEYIKNETVGIHYWTKLWMKINMERP